MGAAVTTARPDRALAGPDEAMRHLCRSGPISLLIDFRFDLQICCLASAVAQAAGR